MAKKQDKRMSAKRLRRALNSAEVPPSYSNRKHLHYRWGDGAGRNQIDACDGSNDADVFAYMDDPDFLCMCLPDGVPDASCMWANFCDCFPDCIQGVGWTFGNMNKAPTTKLKHFMEVA